MIGELYPGEFEAMEHNGRMDALVQEPCDVFDEYGNYKYPSDVELTEPNTATSMPCEDAVSRQEVFNLMRGLTRWCVRSEDGKFNNVGLLYDDVMFGIDGLPPVNPQPKKTVDKLISVNMLDKIRAEIADLDDADYDYEGYYKAVTDAVKIIDKYKAESEVKE